MDIAAVSSALSAVNSYGMEAIGSVPQMVSVKMLDNAMEANEAISSEMIKMMERSVMPNLGGNIDIRI